MRGIFQRICPHCEELILIGENVRDIDRKVFHRECALRMILGSVGHQRKTCCCFGGTGDGDPEGVSVRGAARAALACFEERLRQEKVHQVVMKCLEDMR